jgi:hypothetical protein
VKKALGFSVHTGWAALVAVTRDAVVDRRRIVMNPEPTRFAFHAARELALPAAKRSVAKAAELARRNAEAALRAAVDEIGPASSAGIVVSGRAFAASLEATLASHSLVHEAEGAMYREALRAACRSLGIRVADVARAELARAPQIERPAGPPWGKDQRDACAAARIALGA